MSGTAPSSSLSGTFSQDNLDKLSEIVGEKKEKSKITEPSEDIVIDMLTGELWNRDVNGNLFRMDNGKRQYRKDIIEKGEYNCHGLGVNYDGNTDKTTCDEILRKIVVSSDVDETDIARLASLINSMNFTVDVEKLNQLDLDPYAVLKILQSFGFHYVIEYDMIVKREMKFIESYESWLSRTKKKRSSLVLKNSARIFFKFLISFINSNRTILNPDYVGDYGVSEYRESDISVPEELAKLKIQKRVISKKHPYSLQRLIKYKKDTPPVYLTEEMKGIPLPPFIAGMIGYEKIRFLEGGGNDGVDNKYLIDIVNRIIDILDDEQNNGNPKVTEQIIRDVVYIGQQIDNLYHVEGKKLAKTIEDLEKYTVLLDEYKDKTNKEMRLDKIREISAKYNELVKNIHKKEIEELEKLDKITSSLNLSNIPPFMRSMVPLIRKAAKPDKSFDERLHENLRAIMG